MIKRVINFFDCHRFVLVLLILLLFSLCFFGIKTFLFFHHDFKSFPCTEKRDNTTCIYQDKVIFVNPEESKEHFFKEKKEEIKKLIKDYHLPAFQFYTSYYYEIASLVNYNETSKGEDLLEFFKVYNNSYDITNYYKENVLFYNLFLPYKIA